MRLIASAWLAASARAVSASYALGSDAAAGPARPGHSAFGALPRAAVAASPECRREGLERHSPRVTLEHPVPDDARGLGREVEVLPLVIERIRGRRLHQQTVVHTFNEGVVALRPGVEAHVHHAHDREVLPSFGPRGADRDRHTERGRGLA